jgi:nucleoside-diphosphate-sugar epimerase
MAYTKKARKSLMALYLVTGGGGFIGSHIVDELGRGERVRVLDNFSTGKWENLQTALAQSQEASLEVIKGDICDLDSVHQAMKGVDYVLHQAALPSVPRSIAEPITSHHVNATGTLNVLLAARDAGVKRMVYASSSSIYGDTPVLPKREDMPPRPMSPYAVSKLTGENYCRAFTRVYGLPTVSLRYFNVFGPRQDPASPYAAVIPKFITAMRCGESPTIFGDGLQSRDFTYVANVVQANLLACVCQDGIGEAFNVGCGQRYTLLDLVAQLNAILGTRIAPRLADARPGDVRHSLADIAALEKAAGYRVVASWQTGLEETVNWYRR